MTVVRKKPYFYRICHLKSVALHADLDAFTILYLPSPLIHLFERGLEVLISSLNFIMKRYASKLSVLFHIALDFA